MRDNDYRLYGRRLQSARLTLQTDEGESVSYDLFTDNVERALKLLAPRFPRRPADG